MNKERPNMLTWLSRILNIIAIEIAVSQLLLLLIRGYFMAAWNSERYPGLPIFLASITVPILFVIIQIGFWKAINRYGTTPAVSSILINLISIVLLYLYFGGRIMWGIQYYFIKDIF